MQFADRPLNGRIRSLVLRKETEWICAVMLSLSASTVERDFSTSVPYPPVYFNDLVEGHHWHEAC